MSPAAHTGGEVTLAGQQHAACSDPGQHLATLIPENKLFIDTWTFE